MEPIVHEAWQDGFGEGWMVALQAIGVPDDSSLRHPEQVPFPPPSTPVQSQSCAPDEEDTPSMRELVREINTHVKLVDLEISSNLNVA